MSHCHVAAKLKVLFFRIALSCIFISNSLVLPFRYQKSVKIIDATVGFNNVRKSVNPLSFNGFVINVQ